MPSVPIWLVALVLAALAPWAVRALQAAIETRVRRRTLEVIAGALPAAQQPHERGEDDNPAPGA